MRILLRLISPLLLFAAACGAPQPEAPSPAAEQARAAFPDLGAAQFRAEAILTEPESGRTLPVVMYRDGRKLRLEISGPAGAQVVVFNPDDGENFILADVNGRQAAFRSSGAETPNFMSDWRDLSETGATRIGPCEVAGQSGETWSHTPEGAAGPNVACVTSDGVILSASRNGQPTWTTSKVERGPQSADLFRLPQGVQAVDLPAGTAPGERGALREAVRQRLEEKLKAREAAQE